MATEQIIGGDKAVEHQEEQIDVTNLIKMLSIQMANQGTQIQAQIKELENNLTKKIEKSEVEQEEKLIKTEFKIKQEFENRIQPMENKVQLLETDIDTIRIECCADKNSVKTNISQVIDEVDRLNNDVSFLSEEMRQLNIERNKTKELIAKPNLLLQVTDDKPKFDGNKKGLHPIKFIKKLENYIENFRIEGIHQVHTAVECLEADVRIWAEMHMNEWNNFENFKQDFVDYYWSTTIQEKIRASIYEPRTYDRRLGSYKETKLALELIELDGQGCPNIAVVTDGAWSKQSYRTNYNAL
ncbi:hypothetical protein RN001_006004 [Aquatica leii]|uniref:Uncharacterized protein n=1 Tax=Aquatica leii TaxID=1421715 RepID=A0AAN7P7A4_9COLE|nr:hypothetical protein RN001_006004 [Aquatica leii]